MVYVYYVTSGQPCSHFRARGMWKLGGRMRNRKLSDRVPDMRCDRVMVARKSAAEQNMS
jgi:hypothetical protein